MAGSERYDSGIDERNSFRRHENACCFYRERWIPDDGRRTPDGELILYEVYCLQDRPPTTPEEQAQCFQKRTTCWRTGELLSRMPRVAGMVRPKAASRR
ncbi:MAG TPA: hypothetical protein VMW62_01245 [Chloroflexota bacterium]|nr:hypothetical protein [Chloroflexota bacterium]